VSNRAIDGLRILSDWCKRYQLADDEIVALTSFCYSDPSAHLEFRALLRIWPGRVFTTTPGSDPEEPHIAFDDDGVRVSCVLSKVECLLHASLLVHELEVVCPQ
jgi:hypothetical protein